MDRFRSFFINTLNNPVDLTHVDNLIDGIEASLGKVGYIDTSYISTLWGKSQNEVEKDLDKGDLAFRDADGKKLAGVCSGLALYLNIDVSLIRILFLVVFFFGSAGGWVYLVLWIIAPEARTAAEKCEMRGIPPTAENIRRFSEGR